MAFVLTGLWSTLAVSVPIAARRVNTAQLVLIVYIPVATCLLYSAVLPYPLIVGHV